ncbi:MAG TPA: NAD(P)/FAD-dependent oxidoreductase [Gemmatimonadales bacterium]
MTLDAVVIGAGADGLVAAHYLARAGKRVFVLERRDGNPPWPDAGWTPPRVVRELALARHGLRTAAPDPWLAVPLPDGGRLELWRDVRKSADAIRRLSPRDAERWPAFCERMARLARLLEALYAAPPFDPLSRAPADLWRLALTGLRARRLGRQGMLDLLRLLPMPVQDLLDDWFESDVLKGAVGAAGILHLKQGPRSGGTAFGLLHHHVGSPPGVFRPPSSNLGRVLESLPGVEVRRGDRAVVARIAVRDGRVTGVVLAHGEEIAAPCVISEADPRTTLCDLLEPGWLDPDVVGAVRHVRCRGVTARVMLTLDRAPGFEVLAVAPSLDYLERAYDHAKYGRISEQPYLEARHEAGSNAGEHRVTVHAQFAPYAPADGGWDAARREALGDRGVRTLAEHVPALSDTVVSRTVLAPPDLEAAWGWPEGQPYHAELALDQVLFMRPMPQLSAYRAPVGGLYLCGPAMHPGAGIAGAAGANAAKVVLRDG